MAGGNPGGEGGATGEVFQAVSVEVAQPVPAEGAALTRCETDGPVTALGAWTSSGGYLHVIWFAAWIILGVEHYPYGLLTMIVSLEAIFLSTFVMISQNRADEKRQVLADHQWQTVQEGEQQNEQLLALSNQILELTKAIHSRNISSSDQVP